MTDTHPASTPSEKPRPLWMSLLPDTRGWATAAFFVIEFKLLDMIQHNPTLLANASFMQFAGTLTTGGVLLIASNLFGASKTGSDNAQKITEALTAQASKAAT